jgi:hypothetical protein
MRMFIIPLLLFSTTVSSQSSFDFSDSAIVYRIRHDIYVLASDSFKGREAGTEGEHKAYTYIIRELKKVGVKPWKDSSYLQPFKHNYERFIKPTRLICGTRPFNLVTDFGVTTFSGHDSVTALTADAGYGLIIPESGINDYSGLNDLQDKIVIIDLDCPISLKNNTGIQGGLTPATRIANAVLKGAAGVLLYNSPDEQRKMLFDFTKTDTFTIPVIYITREVQDYLSRHREEPVTIGAGVERYSQTYTNITAYIDNHASHTIIMGAHYDHLGKSDKPKDKGAYCVGADDNASGTAGILELARYYSQNKDPNNNYILIFFSAEEKGLYGSIYFAKHLRPSLKDSINFMLNFDMIGRLGCEGLQVTAEATGSSSSWSKLYREVKHPGFHLKKVSASLPFSDQDAFYRKGIPVLYLNTGLHPQYHTPADRPETINYTGMAGILSYSEKLVSKAGSGDKVPYRKVPAISEYLEVFGFVLGYIGEMLSF